MGVYTESADWAWLLSSQSIRLEGSIRLIVDQLQLENRLQRNIKQMRLLHNEIA